ncbi:sensor histidine kinase [Kineosporia sp. R_H_3]|uniref:sensor histidine kinase n=1 Tax=Kineosporia sp. R_H_3 TaxID=1961848 RepID=UPI000B4A75E9|nr:histidine kinase [Kineosporia sp. R_H_3]
MTTTPTGPPGQPPLTRWGHTWRVLVAAVAGVVSLLVVFAEMPDPDALSDRLSLLLVVDVFVLGPLSLGLLLLHRRLPMTVALVTNALGAVSGVAGPAGLVTLVSVATRRRWREIVPVALVSVSAGMVFEYVYPSRDPLEWWLLLPLLCVLVGGLVAWGLYLGTRRELVESWRLRAEAADREQAVAAERAREAERARIAREMHDVLAHRLSLVSMHAGVLAFRADLEPGEVRSEARVIAEASRQALDELRGVLGVLRDSDAGRPPQPTVADLADLVDQARTAGPVDLETRLDGEPPAPLGRHVYRVVQEGLTNARKHAPGAAVTVRVTGRPGDDLEVEVRNGASIVVAVGAGAPGGSGLGLVGLAERASLAGGRMESGRTADGGWSLRVLLPWPATEDHD